MTSRCDVRAACSGAAPSNASAARIFGPPATTRAGMAQRAIPTLAPNTHRRRPRGTGIESGESSALFSLSSDAGGGEGRGEELRFYWISPLPNPLPDRSSQGEGVRRPAFQGLIQWQCGPGEAAPAVPYFSLPSFTTT